MNTKLTLKIDNSVIKQAKRFAQKHHTSVSKLVESYFRSITIEEKKEEPIEATGVVAELAGVLKNRDISNYDKEYIDYLEEKYK